MSLKQHMDKLVIAGKAVPCKSDMTYRLVNFYLWNKEEKSELIALLGDQLGEEVTETDLGGFPAFGYVVYVSGKWFYGPDYSIVEVTSKEEEEMEYFGPLQEDGSIPANYISDSTWWRRRV